MFAADFVYPGKLYAQIRNSDLKSYLESAEALLPLIAKTRRSCAPMASPTPTASTVRRVWRGRMWPTLPAASSASRPAVRSRRPGR